MLYSKLFPKASKTAPKDAESVNAKYLIQGGFVHQEMAGVYTWLPLGLRVLRNVENIIREEMNALGAQELLMPALQPKANWEKTGRWKSLDVLFKLKSKIGGDIALGPTAEEIITPLVKQFLNSYNNLPLALYQIQNKYRDELRAKAGVLRGREFGMKDLYSFHIEEKNLEEFYEKASKAYFRIFKRCGLNALRVRATGGHFSKFSDEFQVITPSGEDKIYNCKKCKVYYNDELVHSAKFGKASASQEKQFNIVKAYKCPECKHKLDKPEKSIEVGNIFKLGCKFSNAYNLNVLGADGSPQNVTMGCYGIGTTRLVGAVVEVSHDDMGVIWPKEVAPYDVHLVALFCKDKKINKKIVDSALSFLRKQESQGIEVLYDDRIDASVGEKFGTADLLGCPSRIIISEKTLAQNSMEVKDRKTGKMRMEKIK